MAGSRTIISPIAPESQQKQPIKNSTPKMPLTPVQPEAYKPGAVRGAFGRPTVIGPVAPGVDQ